MASLDDFFAKKDKRKKGKSKNFVTSDLLAKTIEEQSVTQPTVEQETKAKIDLPAAPTQDDEWKEEEEQVKDLEGLRVQKLDKDDGEEAEKAQVGPEDDENVVEAESGLPKELTSSSSPWQTSHTQTTDTTSQDDTEPEQEALPETLPNVQGDVYVPPASRGGAYVPPAAREGGAYVPPHAKRGAGGGAYVPPGLRRGGGRGSKAPPDLKSSVAFPSLHNVTKKGDDSSSEKGAAGFTEVQGPKTSRSSDASYHAPGLELTNKFSGLEEN